MEKWEKIHTLQRSATSKYYEAVTKHSATQAAKRGGGRKRGIYLARDLYKVDQLLGFAAVPRHFILFLRERELHQGRGWGEEGERKTRSVSRDKPAME